MLSPEERAKAFRKFCYDEMIDDVDAEFLVVLADSIRDAVADERKACALISRSNNAYETESDIQNVGQSAYDLRRSEKIAPAE